MYRYVAIIIAIISLQGCNVRAYSFGDTIKIVSEKNRVAFERDALKYVRNTLIDIIGEGDVYTSETVCTKQYNLNLPPPNIVAMNRDNLRMLFHQKSGILANVSGFYDRKEKTIYYTRNDFYTLVHEIAHHYSANPLGGGDSISRHCFSEMVSDLMEENFRLRDYIRNSNMNRTRQR